MIQYLPQHVNWEPTHKVQKEAKYRILTKETWTNVVLPAWRKTASGRMTMIAGYVAQCVNETQTCNVSAPGWAPWFLLATSSAKPAPHAKRRQATVPTCTLLISSCLLNVKHENIHSVTSHGTSKSSLPHAKVVMYPQCVQCSASLQFYCCR